MRKVNKMIFSSWTDRILADRYSEEDGHLYGLGDEREPVPGAWTLKKIQNLLLQAHQLHLRDETSDLMTFDKQTFLITGKKDKFAISSWDHATEHLDRGSFGTAFKVWSYTKGKWIVRKIMHWETDNKRDSRIQSFVNEYNVLKQLNQHGSVPGISRKVDLRILQIGEHEIYCLHSRLARYGDLMGALPRGIFSALSARQHFQLIGPLLNGFKTMRQMKVVHQDIGFSNIFVGREKNGLALYFADFGMTATYKDEDPTNFKFSMSRMGRHISTFLNHDAALQYPPEVIKFTTDITANAIPPEELLSRFEEILKRWISDENKETRVDLPVMVVKPTAPQTQHRSCVIL